MTTLCKDPPIRHPAALPPRAPALAAAGVTVRRGGRELLHDVNVSVDRDQLVAIAGGSGAGKTTLLRVLAGLVRPTRGDVVHPGVRPSAGGATVGFVPQEDIVHRELPVRSTLDYAAALRLPAHLRREDRDREVGHLMAVLGLADRADVRVGSLSGGQRKRVSIAVELLSRPDVLLLDEPTSGLDPATATDVMSLLRRLACRGVAVALTTHREADIEACDRVVFLAGGGRVAFDGPVALALRQLEVDRISDLYHRLDAASSPLPEHRNTSYRDVAEPHRSPTPELGSHAGSGGEERRQNRVPPWRQALLLTRRNAEVMVRSRLTLAVLLGSPVLVIAMMATLFDRWSLDGTDASALASVQVTYWLAFAGFFFGLTYGLLQVVVERPVLERERFAGLSVSAYLASKVLVLAPLLTAVAMVLLGTLRALDRLPAVSWPTMVELLAILVAGSLSALALGLLASALVRDPAQATLALPMLCFPQVLFAGAIVPVVQMTAPGRGLSAVLVNRWVFQGLGRGLGLGERSQAAALTVHGTAFDGSLLSFGAPLGAGVVVLSVLTWWVVRRTTPAPPRGQARPAADVRASWQRSASSG